MNYFKLCDKYNGVHCAFVTVCDEQLCPLKAQYTLYSLGGDTVDDLLTRIENLEYEVEDKRNKINELYNDMLGANNED